MNSPVMSPQIERPQIFRCTERGAKRFATLLRWLVQSFVFAVALPSASAHAWTQVPGSGFVTSVAVMPNGTILGVGTDKLLWTRASLTSEWLQIPRSGFVTSVAALPDGSLLGVGTDQALWSRKTLTSEWASVPNSAPVVGVAVMPSGVILGVGADKALRTKTTLASAWSLVPDSGSVTSVAVMSNGTILGVGTDNFLWMRPTLTAAWTQVPDSGLVMSVAVMVDGTLVGVGTDNTLWTRAKPEVAAASGASAVGERQASPDNCPNCPPWVARSFTGNYLPLAAQAEIWSEPKRFKGVDHQLTVQSRFMGQKGTTCRFEVQFNNVLDKPIDEKIVLSRHEKAAVSQYDTVLRAKLQPRTSKAYGTEVRECPLNWGETKAMDKCAECAPIVYFWAQ
jgi:hypothetical protein